MAIIECVPNVSEGRRSEVLDACADAIRSAGVRLLDVKPDASHNRTVFTFAGEPQAVKAAVSALFAAALPRIDLRQHAGEHPRMGAVDVVPFIPIEGVTMADCVRLAVDVAGEVSAAHALPVFLYEEAARQPGRRNLEDIRRGEFEGLAAKLKQPDWQPDFGPAVPNVSAGATVIGARMPLIAYNINLATDRALLRELRQRHIGIAIDDFGVGQTSLIYLRQFPINTIKIDKVFINDILTDGTDAAIVSTIVDLAHTLGLCATAEGVENEEQVEMLEHFGCDRLQGFHFSRPVPATSLAQLL